MELRNKRGWVKIVEVFIAILLMTGVLMLVLTREETSDEDISLDIYQKQTELLRSIELNQSLRNDILSVSVPVGWDDFDSSGLDEVKSEIILRIPDNLDCQAKLCIPDDACFLEGLPSDKSIYVESVFIAGNFNNYAPRQLKLFCWLKS